MDCECALRSALQRRFFFTSEGASTPFTVARTAMLSNRADY
jgi:hypothetical protein